jgi:hypothetical protein
MEQRPGCHRTLVNFGLCLGVLGVVHGPYCLKSKDAVAARHMFRAISYLRVSWSLGGCCETPRSS